jgi:hypothetical protein
MQVQQDSRRIHFVLGNIILGLAAVMLLFIGSLWEHLGIWALLLWMVLAIVGVYFISKDATPPPSGPPN